MPLGLMTLPIGDFVATIESPAPGTIEEFDRISREFCEKYWIPYRGLGTWAVPDESAPPVALRFHERPYIPPPVVVADAGPTPPITADLFA
jgi:hypothetical protein